mmetsp:Transcript_14546/g.34552  ORF Transcript_14546/g.34552 Transcript_14546/m.34552 type:complete len:233 (+) Transcript_14546:612-1310(+)
MDDALAAAAAALWDRLRVDVELPVALEHRLAARAFAGLREEPPDEVPYGPYGDEHGSKAEAEGRQERAEAPRGLHGLLVGKPLAVRVPEQGVAPPHDPRVHGRHDERGGVLPGEPAEAHPKGVHHLRALPRGGGGVEAVRVGDGLQLLRGELGHGKAARDRAAAHPPLDAAHERLDRRELPASGLLVLEDHMDTEVKRDGVEPATVDDLHAFPLCLLVEGLHVLADPRDLTR